MSRERQRKYEKTEKGRASARGRARRYRASLHGYLVYRRWELRKAVEEHTNQLKEIEDGNAQE